MEKLLVCLVLLGLHEKSEMLPISMEVLIFKFQIFEIITIFPIHSGQNKQTDHSTEPPKEHLYEMKTTIYI